MINGAAGLAAIEEEWWALWRRCPAATPFQSPAWLIPWWRHFTPGRLATVAVRREGRLVGLAPFYLEADTGRLMPVGISLSDFLDVLIEPGDDGEVAAAMVRAALDFSWSAWSFEELPPEAAAWRLPCPQSCRETTDEQSLCPVLALESDGDWGGAVPAKRLAGLRHERARAARLGAVEIVKAGAEPNAFLDELFGLHAARWQGRGEAGVLADARVQGFHRETLPLLAAQGLARCTLLRIDGEAAAAHYGLADGRRAFFYIGGFDPRFAAGSPGSLLIGHAIAEAKREGLAEFHFLRGQEPYKYAWGAQDRPNGRRLWERRP
ncbi:MAG TPA: GNAT family N-acetyltransferase [Mesorhizobium sp.]|nr:GNAT family N-acetyltransferase [Mesorhizobium sp.]